MSTKPLKPMRASDGDLDRMKFPGLAQPKIDGVRGINQSGQLTTRELKPFGNRYITELFSHPALLGFDGEFAAEDERHPNLCRLTNSATSTQDGEPWLMWHVFDYVRDSVRDLPYLGRLHELTKQVAHIKRNAPELGAHLKIILSREVHTREQYEDFHGWCIENGYEGSIYRGIDAPHKSGYSTVREGGLLRFKDFVEGEAEVLELHEGETNTNEATLSPLGYTERSTKKEGMVPNGKVGKMTCRVLKDINDLKGELLFPVGSIIFVSAGSMPHPDRVRYMAQPSLLVGQPITFQTFPHGVKDKPRFATFKTIRKDM